MSDHKRFLYLLLIMTTVALLVMGITDYLLYRAAFKEEQERLVVTVQSQARFIEAVARFDAIYSNDYPDGSYSATVSQIIEAHKNYKGFGLTGEFTLARLEGDSIVFLLSHRHYDLEKPRSIPFGTELAEPMRLALSGKSGTITGLDYRGENVLAAYEPVAELHLGLVAKIDLTEIRAPFIRASLIALISAVIIVLIGSLLFRRISNPVLQRLREYAERLEKMVAKRTMNLQESEVRLKAAQRIARLGSWDWNIKDNSEIWSDEQLHIFGYKPGEITPTHQLFLDAIHPDDSDFVIDTLQKTLFEKQPYQIEFRIIRPNREVRTILAQGQVYRDQQDKPIRMIGIAQDITERKKAEEEVKKLSETVEQSPDMVFITNPNGKIEYVNPAFTEITGYSAEDALGATPTILSSGEMSEEYFQQFWSTILSGKTFRSEVINRKKNGELFIYDQTITPLKDADGNTINFISTGKDITERVESRKKLEEALEKADQANRVKSLFIANMSHEIRTPLSSILGFTELIEISTRDLVGEEEKEFFDIIKNSGNRLIRTVHEILDISQIEAGSYELKMEQLDLCKMVKDLVNGCRLLANEKNLKLEYESNLDSAFIQADQNGVSQAINNIIDNAVKYTEKGKITVLLQQSSGQYVLSIQDTGIGIYKEYVDNLYEVFSQESEGYTKKFQGIGLGMAIAKRHLDLNHVDINVESTKGVGTIFTLTFKPLKNHIPEKQVGKEEVKVIPTAEPVEKPLVLVVEDAPNFKKLTEVFLKANFTTYFAVSVEEAKQQLNKYPINLILLDLSLVGDEDGLDLARYLRKTKQWRNIPIIALTAHAFTTDRDNCLAAGCNDYITKPIKQQDLLAKLKMWLKE